MIANILFWIQSLFIWHLSLSHCSFWDLQHSQNLVNFVVLWLVEGCQSSFVIFLSQVSNELFIFCLIFKFETFSELMVFREKEIISWNISIPFFETIFQPPEILHNLLSSFLQFLHFSLLTTLFSFAILFLDNFTDEHVIVFNFKSQKSFVLGLVNLICLFVGVNLFINSELEIFLFSWSDGFPVLFADLIRSMLF